MVPRPAGRWHAACSQFYDLQFHDFSGRGVLLDTLPPPHVLPHPLHGQRAAGPRLIPDFEESRQGLRFCSHRAIKLSPDALRLCFCVPAAQTLRVLSPSSTGILTWRGRPKKTKAPVGTGLDTAYDLLHRMDKGGQQKKKQKGGDGKAVKHGEPSSLLLLLGSALTKQRPRALQLRARRRWPRTRRPST